MNDRELLELAAKAAGISWDVSRDSITGWMLVTLCEDDDSDGHMVEDKSWRPLQDDGDAMRLAVKLRLQITPGTYNKDQFSAFQASSGEALEYWTPAQDEYAATRRAIVRAAAKIGRTMP